MPYTSHTHRPRLLNNLAVMMTGAVSHQGTKIWLMADKNRPILLHFEISGILALFGVDRANALH